MSYYYLESKYPFQPSNLQGNITTNNIKKPETRYGFNFKLDDPNCKNITYKLSNESDVMFGYKKPLDEKCPVITGNLTYDPSTSQNALWNNSTKRKVIVNNKMN